MDPFFDLPDGLRRFLIRHRAADDVAARLLQPEDLRHGSLHVLRARIRHGLDQNRASAADHAVSDLNLPRMLSVHTCLPLFLPPQAAF